MTPHRAPDRKSDPQTQSEVLAPGNFEVSLKDASPGMSLLLQV
jgi:hypothetical protein